MHKSLFCLALCLASALPRTAEAQERVLVLDIALTAQDAGQEEHQSVAALLTDRLRAEIAAVEGWELSPTRMTTREARDAQGCDQPERIERYDVVMVTQTAACFRQIAEAAGVGHVVFGTLRPHSMQEPNPFTITLSRYERASDRFAGSTYRSIRTDGPPEEIAARMQQIIGDDDLDIRPRTTRAAEHASEPEPQHPSPGPSIQTWLGVGALTLAAGSLAAMIGSWVRINDIQSDPVYHGFRSTPWPEGTTDVCTEAQAGRGPEAQVAQVRSLCDEAAVWEALQWIFLVSGIGFATMGTALITLDLGGGEQLELQPTAGPTGAALDATLRF